MFVITKKKWCVVVVVNKVATKEEQAYSGVEPTISELHSSQPCVLSFLFPSWLS